MFEDFAIAQEALIIVKMWLFSHAFPDQWDVRVPNKRVTYEDVVGRCYGRVCQLCGEIDNVVTAPRRLLDEKGPKCFACYNYDCGGLVCFCVYTNHAEAVRFSSTTRLIHIAKVFPFGGHNAFQASQEHERRSAAELKDA